MRPSATFAGDLAAELHRFDEHLRDVRGLSTGTRHQRASIVGRLLQRKFADRPIDIARLRPEDVRRFLADQLDVRRTPSNASRLTIRQTKFAKSRQLPMHPSTVKALARYRRQRALHVATTAETPFLIGSRGRRLGQPLGDRQAHRVFNALRDNLGWVNRGAHDAPRLHDLRHTFVVRRLMLWHADGTDIDQMMLALSTYLGHAEIFYTYWYLTAVPELMALAGGKFERFADLRGDGDE
jgi:integrase